jgi:hypothetical protein
MDQSPLFLSHAGTPFGASPADASRIPGVKEWLGRSSSYRFAIGSSLHFPPGGLVVIIHGSGGPLLLVARATLAQDHDSQQYEQKMRI